MLLNWNASLMYQPFYIEEIALLSIVRAMLIMANLFYCYKCLALGYWLTYFIFESSDACYMHSSKTIEIFKFATN